MVSELCGRVLLLGAGSKATCMPCKVEPLLLLVTLEEIPFPETSTVQAVPYAALAAASSKTGGVMLKSDSRKAAAFPQADDGDVP